MYELLSIPTNKRILIFAPHPDDDCIGMGVTIFSFIQKKNRIKIIYMTSGWRGVKGNMSIEGKKLLREKETINACRILGVVKKSAKFLNLPFYDTAKISFEDVDLVKVEIEKFKPDIIFACGEFDDPHRTHGKCLKIVDKVLKKVEFAGEIFFYRVWKDWSSGIFDFFLPFDKELMKKKIKAIKAHKSQLQPLFTKKGVSSFWEREVALNKKFALHLKRRGLLRGTNFLFSEVFKRGPAHPERYSYLGDKK
jgi:glucosamine-6-phosphate deaminase